MLISNVVALINYGYVKYIDILVQGQPYLQNTDSENYMYTYNNYTLVEIDTTIQSLIFV